MMKKQLFSLMFLLLPFLGVSQDFMIWQKPTAPNPPLGRYVLLDDGSGNYTKATLQSIIEQVNVPEAEGDGFVSGLNWSSVSKTLTVFQTGANQHAVTLTGLDYTLPAGTASVRGGFRLGTGFTITNGDVLNVNSTGYTLPTATTLTKGGIRIGTGVSMNADVLSVPIASASTRGSVQIGTGLTMTGAVLSLPAATASARGGIRVGSGLIISSGDIVSVDPTLADYNLPAATASTRGGIRLGTGFTVSNGDVVSVAAGGYTLPAATASVRGGIRVGSGLSISGDVLSATGTTYNLPAATASVRGGIKVGAGLAITSDVLRLNLTPAVVERKYPSSSFTLSGSYVEVFDETFTVTSGALVLIDVNIGSNSNTEGDLAFVLYVNGVAQMSEYEYLPTSNPVFPRGNINLSHQLVAPSSTLTVRVEGRMFSGSNHNVIAKSMRVTQIK